MSIQAVGWVLDHSEATGSDRLVLIALANHADKEELRAWPSLVTLAREARIDRRTVVRVIQRLEADGQIEVERKKRPGRNHVNRYRIITERGEERVAERDPSSEKGWRGRTERVAGGSANGVTGATGTIEPKENREGAALQPEQQSRNVREVREARSRLRSAINHHAVAAAPAATPASPPPAPAGPTPPAG